MTSISNTLRRFVRKHELRFAKAIYRNAAVPVYRLAAIPVYDITASFQHAYTWFRIPKNATHSIMLVLSESTEITLNSSDVPYFSRAHRNNFRFCFIRNPWDRLVSAYANKVEMQLMFPACWGKDFAYFIDFVSKQNLRTCDPHLRLQTRMFPKDDVNFVGRVERLETDLQLVMQHIGIASPIPHEGQVTHQHYRMYYSDALRDKVGELYLRDVEFGDYDY